MPRRTSVGMAAMENRPHTLYRFYDRTNVLLYIGITVNLEERIKQHAGDKDWWPRVDRAATRIEFHNSRSAALAAEREAIKAEQPLHNDAHNEWVGVDDDEESADELHDFAIETLSWLDAVEIDSLLAEAAVDDDGNPREKRNQEIAAAEAAIVHLWRDRRALAQSIDEYLDLLPEGAGDYHRFQARENWRQRNKGENARQSNAQLTQNSLDSLLDAQALKVLKALPDNEAGEWVASAAALEIQGTKQKIVFGARYAMLYKHSRTTFKKLCGGPGKHGARCPNRADTMAFFEACGTCEDSFNCQGHTFWCSPHAEMVRAGDVSMLGCQPATWPLARIEPIAERDPWGVPF